MVEHREGPIQSFESIGNSLVYGIDVAEFSAYMPKYLNNLRQPLPLAANQSKPLFG